jgi:outer membrane protein assembly factor BamA
LKKIPTKITLLIVIIGLIYSCDSVKRVPDNKQLLTKVEITVDGNSKIKEDLTGFIFQKPNARLLKVPFGLYVYNWARPNPDSVFRAKYIEDTIRFKRMSAIYSEKQVYRLGESFYMKGFHELLKSTGEKPVIIDSSRTKRSEFKLRSHFYNNGFFDVEVKSETDSVGFKKGKIKYIIDLKSPYILDTIKATISSPDLDSLYQVTKSQSLIKSGQQYNSKIIEEERNRLTTYFRNNGAYNFQQNYITFDVDTINLGKKPNITTVIEDFNYRENDTLKTAPFHIYKISEVNIFTDNPTSKDKKTITDSVYYKGFNLYSIEKLRFKPKAITDAVFIYKGGVYADFRNNLTSRFLSNLKVFNYPSIKYEQDPKDSTGTSLIANIYLNPRKKITWGATLDLTHSNIQEFGITGNTSVNIRNVFNGAETFEIALRGNIGSSRDNANPDNIFFNILELGVDGRLSFPRIFFPVNTEKIIPKNMIPSSVISAGFSSQTNVGLDKENFTGGLTYNWTPKRLRTARFELVNLQYVNNLNVSNYFNVYRSSFNALNTVSLNYPVNPLFYEDGLLIINSGTDGFLNDVLRTPPPDNLQVSDEDFEIIRSIDERRSRLTENNFIMASSFSYSISTRSNLVDNSFYIFKTKIELAGNTLSLLANAANQPLGPNGNQTFMGVEFSQYIKTEFDFVKLFDLQKENVFATRYFLGVAIPYGNAQNIPFSRSYFAGGSNDNRAWQPYSLGPGSSGAQDDFNDANLKIALSAEYRFKLFGNFKGALFADAGNIWNFMDNVTIQGAVFEDLESLKDIALGTGFGLRYDFSFFVVRFDIGFKTYNPANDMDRRWFNEYNFSNSVLNIGINYPF